jgi:hypothetical protein
MTGKELQSILQGYGVEYSALDEYDLAVKQASAVRGAIKLTCEPFDVCLKRTDISEKRLRYADQMMTYLRGQGLDVPTIVRTRYGDAYVAHDSGHYYVTVWEQGTHPNMKEADTFVKASGWLGTWHRIANSFTPSDPLETIPPNPENRLIRSLGELQQLAQIAVDDARGLTFAAKVQPDISRLTLAVEQALLRLQNLKFNEYQEEAAQRLEHCHGRFLDQNLVRNQDRWVLVNYENLYYGSPLYEFALFIHRYGPNIRWNARTIEKALQAYQTAYAKPFSADDEERLFALLMAPFRTLQVISWYILQARDWSEDEYAQVFRAALGSDLTRESVFANGRAVRRQRAIVTAKQKPESKFIPEHPVAAKDAELDAALASRSDSRRPGKETEKIDHAARKGESTSFKQAVFHRTEKGVRIQVPEGRYRIESGLTSLKSTAKKRTLRKHRNDIDKDP